MCEYSKYIVLDKFIGLFHSSRILEGIVHNSSGDCTDCVKVEAKIVTVEVLDGLVGNAEAVRTPDIVEYPWFIVHYYGIGKYGCIQQNEDMSCVSNCFIIFHGITCQLHYLWEDRSWFWILGFSQLFLLVNDCWSFYRFNKNSLSISLIKTK